MSDDPMVTAIIADVETHKKVVREILDEQLHLGKALGGTGITERLSIKQKLIVLIMVSAWTYEIELAAKELIKEAMEEWPDG